MTKNIIKAAGKINYLNGDASAFSSLEELMEIISQDSEKLPEYIIILGKSAHGKTFQLGLDYNIFSETGIDINSLRTAKFQRFLGDILVNKGLVTPNKLNEALTEQKQSVYNERIGEVLIRLGFVTYDQIIAALNDQMGIAKE